MMNPETTKRRPGRPKSNTEARVQQTFRVSAEIDDLIRAAAETNCRSISEELESRIEASFSGLILENNIDIVTDAVNNSASERKITVEQEIKRRIRNSFLVDTLLQRSDLVSLLMLVAMDIIEYEEKEECNWKEEVQDNSIDIQSVIAQIVAIRVGQEKDRYKIINTWINERKESIDVLRTFVP